MPGWLDKGDGKYIVKEHLERRFIIYRKMTTRTACFIYFIHSFISRHTSETFVFLLSSTLTFFREFLLPLFQSCACWGSQFKFCNSLVLVGIRPGLAQTIPRPQWLKQGEHVLQVIVSISPSRVWLGLKEPLGLCCWEYVNRGLADVLFPVCHRIWD